LQAVRAQTVVRRRRRQGAGPGGRPSAKVLGGGVEMSSAVEQPVVLRAKRRRTTTAAGGCGRRETAASTTVVATVAVVPLRRLRRTERRREIDVRRVGRRAWDFSADRAAAAVQRRHVTRQAAAVADDVLRLLSRRAETLPAGVPLSLPVLRRPRAASAAGRAEEVGRQTVSVQVRHWMLHG